MPPLTTAPLAFPGRLLKKELTNNAADVRAVQQRLNEVGCGPLDDTGNFDNQTFNAVKLFQSRFTDIDGLPLEIDGEVGSLTWSALFGAQSVPITHTADSPLLDKVLAIAATQVGVMEVPPGSNRGPQVDKYLRTVGLDPAAGSFAWCVAFIYFCFEEAAKKQGRANPMIKTAGVLNHWNLAGTAGIPRITAAKAIGQPGLVKPGHIFVIDTGGGFGHSGLIERVIGSKLVTIEGNSNDGGSREGLGVFRRSMRKVTQINKGFIDYSNA